MRQSPTLNDKPKAEVLTNLRNALELLLDAEEFDLVHDLLRSQLNELYRYQDGELIPRIDDITDEQIEILYNNIVYIIGHRLYRNHPYHDDKKSTTSITDKAVAALDKLQYLENDPFKFLTLLFPDVDRASLQAECDREAQKGRILTPQSIYVDGDKVINMHAVLESREVENPELTFNYKMTDGKSIDEALLRKIAARLNSILDSLFDSLSEYHDYIHEQELTLYSALCGLTNQFRHGGLATMSELAATRTLDEKERQEYIRREQDAGIEVDISIIIFNHILQILKDDDRNYYHLMYELGFISTWKHVCPSSLTTLKLQPVSQSDIQHIGCADFIVSKLIEFITSHSESLVSVKLNKPALFALLKNDGIDLPASFLYPYYRTYHQSSIPQKPNYNQFFTCVDHNHTLTILTSTDIGTLRLRERNNIIEVHVTQPKLFNPFEDITSPISIKTLNQIVSSDAEKLVDLIKQAKADGVRLPKKLVEKRDIIEICPSIRSITCRDATVRYKKISLGKSTLLVDTIHSIIANECNSLFDKLRTIITENDPANVQQMIDTEFDQFELTLLAKILKHLQAHENDFKIFYRAILKQLNLLNKSGSISVDGIAKFIRKCPNIIGLALPFATPTQQKQLSLILYSEQQTKAQLASEHYTIYSLALLVLTPNLVASADSAKMEIIAYNLFMQFGIFCPLADVIAAIRAVNRNHHGCLKQPMSTSAVLSEAMTTTTSVPAKELLAFICDTHSTTPRDIDHSDSSQPVTASP